MHKAAPRRAIPPRSSRPILPPIRTAPRASASITPAGRRSGSCAAAAGGRRHRRLGSCAAGAGRPAALGLGRIAFAVDGVESRHGADPGMWRADLAGPHGPMQVSLAAARDVGGGDRFDPARNRALGRAYLAHLYRRYGNWADAVMAYNWGPANLDLWIAAGRPAGRLPAAVERYRDQVLEA